ncbi:MAG: hypothetical protein ACMG55_03325 [Microcoleus sp.]
MRTFVVFGVFKVLGQKFVSEAREDDRPIDRSILVQQLFLK